MDGTTHNGNGKRVPLPFYALTMIIRYVGILLLCLSEGFSFNLNAGLSSRRLSLRAASATSETEQNVDVVPIEPKEAVKLFGRLAEKYIMLDESAGMCCYSACSDCEYRLPDGGYRMADQSAARPKWIPNYVFRAANNKEHTTKWSSELFIDGPALKKDEFVERIKQLAYAPTLGGPYIAASGAAIDDDLAARALFEVLANGKEVLTKSKMSMRIKQLAGGEEGLTWAMFIKALGG